MKRAQLSMAREEKRTLLIAARGRLHLSQEEVAKRLGVSKSTVHRWEQKGDIPQPYHLRELCKLFGVPSRELGFVEAIAEEESVAEERNKPEIEIVATFHQQNLISRLMRTVWNWQDRDARYHGLQRLVALQLEDNSTMSAEELINRRDALRFLALVPIDMLGLSQSGAVLRGSNEDVFTHCAAGIVACAYLRRGKDLVFADWTVSRYIPALKGIVKSAPESQRKAAADLLAQALLLKAVLSRHTIATNDALNCAQQAMFYGEIAESRLLQVLALRVMTPMFSSANQWDQALLVAEQAKYLLEQKPTLSPLAEKPIPQLVYSYVYAGLATYQSYHGRKKDALLSLKKAHKAFFEQSADEETPIWIHHHIGNLLINDGETYTHLGLYSDAQNSLELINTRYAQDTTIPLTCRVNALTTQIMAEVNRDDKPRDMQWCIDLWKQAIEEAKMLQSNMRFNAAVHAYTAMCAAWPSEKQVKDLREYIVHW